MMLNIVNAFIKSENGATAIEYSLVAGLIAVAIVAAVGAAGSNLTNKFGQIANNLT